MSLPRITGRARVGLVAGLATFAVLAGTVTGHAYWTAQSTASLGVGAGTVSVTSTGFAPATTTFGNGSIQAAGNVGLAMTGSITITNTTSTSGSQTQNLTVVFSRSGGNTTLAAATTLTAWPVANAGLCTPSATPPGGSASGTWNAGVTVAATLAPGASTTYCLRNTIADRQNVAASGGTLSFTPQAAVSLATGSFAGSATPTGTIQTQYIHPLSEISAGWWYYVKRAGSTWCWDISGSGSSNGSLLISYACKNNADLNQDFRYTPIGGGYGDFRPRHATGLRVDAGSSTTSGSAVDMRTASSAASQQWQPQLVSGSGDSGVYQFVNKNSGLCLSMPAVSTGTATQVTCSGGADQRFTLEPRSAVQLTSFTCGETGSGANRTVIYSWTSDWSGGPYAIQALRSGSWTTLGTTSGTSLNVGRISTSLISGWSNGTYDVRITNSTGETVGTDQIRLAGSGSSRYARCS